MTIEKRLQEARKSRGISQNELAKRISLSSSMKVSRQTICNWEREKGHSGHRDIPAEMVPHVAMFLKFNLEWLFTGKGPRDNEPQYRIMYLSEQLLNKTTEKQRRGLELLLDIRFPLEGSHVEEYSLSSKGDANGEHNQ